MYTLRCTRKLLKRLGAAPCSAVVEPTTVLGDWYANLLYTRPQQLVLAMNERSLLCVLVPAREAGRLGARVKAAAQELLLELGVPLAVAAREGEAMKDMHVGATLSRAILGCMNDAVVQLSWKLQQPGVSLLEAELHLAGNIYSLTKYQPPGERVLGLFRVSGGMAGRRGGERLH